MKKWEHFSDDEIIQMVQNSFSMRELTAKLGYSIGSGSGAKSVEQMLKEKNIDYSHFNNRSSWNQHKKYVGEKKYTIEEVFIESSPYSRRLAKQYIIDYNLIPYQCNKCGNTGQWQNEPLALELHHQNGINNDHRLSNLVFLCPNCHAQTDTYGGKNSKIAHTNRELTDAERIQRAKEQANNHCIICNKLISKKGKYCEDCYHLINRKIERPTREKLKELIRNNSFLAIAHMYNNEITDNGIRKWCDSYKLPRTKTEINKYSDEEWASL